MVRKAGVFLFVVSIALLQGCGCDDKKPPEPLPPQQAVPAQPAPPAPLPPPPVPAAPAGAEKKPTADAPKAAEPDPNSTAITFGKDVKHSMNVPKAWVMEEPSNNMRLLQMKIPHVAGDTDDGDFAMFKMAGGGADQNIKRWVGQFGGGDDALKSRKDVKTASGLTATLADLEGTYAAMSMAGVQPPKPDYKMLGAIIETDEGEYFIKSAGPQKTMEQQKDAFQKMVESFK